MAALRSTDHVSRGVRKLLAQFRQPKIEALLSSFLAEVQKLENAAWEVADHLSIAAGFGTILDNIGRLVGRGRDGYSDDRYKVALRAQIRINRAIGNEADTIAVADLSTDTTDEFASRTFPPSSYLVDKITPLGDTPLSLLALNLRQVRPWGTRADLVYNESPRAEVFLCGWAQDPTLIPAAQGCGWEGDATIGGRLSASEEL